ncbi:hypothetical protein VKT23_015984 [Stygiomarasmius scandens]|uniref:Uncharacterized protein n=1 Tax=Marasmiellus scandens TaxID=2682957 RepID=A0ABR1IYY5_9AGAR
MPQNTATSKGAKKKRTYETDSEQDSIHDKRHATYCSFWISWKAYLNIRRKKLAGSDNENKKPKSTSKNAYVFTFLEGLALIEIHKSKRKSSEMRGQKGSEADTETDDSEEEVKPGSKRTKKKRRKSMDSDKSSSESDAKSPAKRKKKSKKKRSKFIESDDDEWTADNVYMYLKRNKKDGPGDKSLRDLGKWVGRALDSWTPIRVILFSGIMHDGIFPMSDDETLPSSSDSDDESSSETSTREEKRKHHVQCYNKIKKRSQLMVDLISLVAKNKSLKVLNNMAAAIETGRHQARTADTHLARYELPRLLVEDDTLPILRPIPNGALKSQRGLNHPDIAMLWVPWHLVERMKKEMLILRKENEKSGAELELWQKPGSVLERMMNEEIDLISTHMWFGLYERLLIDGADSGKGLFLNFSLLRLARGVFRGKTAIYGTKKGPSRPSNAEIHNIRRTSPTIIAYICMLLRFSMSIQEKFGDDDSSIYSFKTFYFTVIRYLEDPRNAKLTKYILEIWDNDVFGIKSKSANDAANLIWSGSTTQFDLCLTEKDLDNEPVDEDNGDPELEPRKDNTLPGFEEENPGPEFGIDGDVGDDWLPLPAGNFDVALSPPFSHQKVTSGSLFTPQQRKQVTSLPSPPIQLPQLLTPGPSQRVKRPPTAVLSPSQFQNHDKSDQTVDRGHPHYINSALYQTPPSSQHIEPYPTYAQPWNASAPYQNRYPMTHGRLPHDVGSMVQLPPVYPGHALLPLNSSLASPIPGHNVMLPPHKHMTQTTGYSVPSIARPVLQQQEPTPGPRSLQFHATKPTQNPFSPFAAAQAGAQMHLASPMTSTLALSRNADRSDNRQLHTPLTLPSPKTLLSVASARVSQSVQHLPKHTPGDRGHASKHPFICSGSTGKSQQLFTAAKPSTNIHSSTDKYSPSRLAIQNLIYGKSKLQNAPLSKPPKPTLQSMFSIPEPNRQGGPPASSSMYKPTLQSMFSIPEPDRQGGPPPSSSVYSSQSSQD